MKSIVYETPVATEQELIRRIETAAQEIRNSPGMLQKIYPNMIRRCNACIEVRGRHFEQLLW